MTKMYLFKVKEGKLDQWINWVYYLIDHEDEVLETMEHENAVREMFTLFEVNDEHYVVGMNDFLDAPVPADMDVELNQLHRQHMRECLERLGNGEVLYNFVL